jgi:histidyl-tRNA synthetase
MAASLAVQHDWFSACRLAGYQAAAVPPVGYSSTFTTGHHAAGQKLYQFADKNGRNLALVSDSLPAMLRLARARGLPEQRLSYCCQVFRYERRPRRHFHHLGLMEVTGQPAGLAAQLRATARLAHVLTGFLASRIPVTFTITDPGLWRSLAVTAVPEEDVSALLDSLRRLPPQERPRHLRQQGAPAMLIYLAELLAADPALALETSGQLQAGLSRHEVHERVAGAWDLADALRRRGVTAEIDLGSLHASEFHDGPSFLITAQGQRRLLGDGGTYGQFAREFLGSPAAVHSAVIGLERLIDLTATANAIPPADVAVIARPEPGTIAHADRLAASLREAGIAVWDIVQSKSLDKHLRDLSALAIPLMVLIGPRELGSASYTVRDLAGVLHFVPEPELAAWIAARRSPPAAVSHNARRHWWRSD